MDNSNSSNLNSFFGEGTILKGKLKFKNLVRFDGEFDGEIESSGTLVIGASGKVSAGIKTVDLYNFGSVTGNVNASGKISLHDKSSLSGNIVSPFFTTEEGSVFNGKCVMPLEIRNTSTTASAPPKKDLEPEISSKVFEKRSDALRENKASGSGGMKKWGAVAAGLVAAFLAIDSMLSGDETKKISSGAVTVTKQEPVKVAEIKKDDKPVEAVPEEIVVELVEAPPEKSPMDKAQENINDGNLAEAIKNLEQALSEDEADVDVRSLLAHTYQNAGLEKKAYDEFEKLESESSESVKLVNAGFGLIDSGEYTEASNNFKKVLKENEGDNRARLGLALAYMRSGGNKKAVSELELILQENADYAPALNRLAWIMAKEGEDLDRAKEMSKRSLNVFPDIPEYIDTLSEVNYRLGEYDEAISLIKKAIAIVPDDRYYERQLFKFEKSKEQTAG